jgi:hypothetical protein
MSFPQRTISANTASHSSAASGLRNPKRGLKQSSLFDLAGVIGLERLERHHRVLRDPKIDPEVSKYVTYWDDVELKSIHLLSTLITQSRGSAQTLYTLTTFKANGFMFQEGIRILRELGSKSPSTKIIIDTGIGKTVRKLSKSKSVDPGIAAEARVVYKKWRAAVERRVSLEERGPVDVLCDLPTTTRREKCRSLLKEALGGCSEVAESFREGIVNKTEKELFDQCKHLVRDEYRRRTRKLYFALRHDASLRNALLVQRTLSIKRLVSDSK